MVDGHSLRRTVRRLLHPQPVLGHGLRPEQVEEINTLLTLLVRVYIHTIIVNHVQ